jgi:hypothetical protein
MKTSNRISSVKKLRIGGLFFVCLIPMGIYYPLFFMLCFLFFYFAQTNRYLAILFFFSVFLNSQGNMLCFVFMLIVDFIVEI